MLIETKKNSKIEPEEHKIEKSMFLVRKVDYGFTSLLSGTVIIMWICMSAPI